MLSAFGGGNDLTSTIVWFVFLFVFILFGPRLMVAQTILKLEREVAILEGYATASKNTLMKTLKKKTPKNRKAVENFMDFFAVPPVSTDPYGIMKKIDHLIKRSEYRFDYFVNQLEPDASIMRKRDLKGALSGAITTNQIAKIVRHFLELIKKYKMFQLGMIIQMQLPLIKEIARAARNATDAFVNEDPIGDSIGPLVAAKLIKDKPKIYKDEEFVSYKTKILGKTVFISKADGPGATVGRPGKFLLKFLSKNRINRIIMVDAAGKMEGEKAGVVAEGVGAGIGPGGTAKYYIEEIATKKNIPLDAIGIKVSQEDALNPMIKELINSVPNTLDVLNDNIKRGPKNEKILVIGVGNTCGVGNNIKAVAEAEKKIRKTAKRIEEEKEKKKGFFKKRFK